MSKAENLALKKYPEHSLLIVPARRGGYYADNHLRAGFIAGYHQAEKDLALTWEDMMLIHKCIKDAMNYNLYKMMEGIEGQEEVYQEVLKRFLETKNKSKSLN